jgi:IS30 family transposase
LTVSSTDRRNTLPFETEVECDAATTEATHCTAAESAEIWDRWQKGEGLKSIGRVFDKSSGSIFSHISPTGGIRPPARRRSRLALTLVEREEISRGLVNGRSLRVIACGMGRAPSTVSREIARNGGRGWYRAAASDRQAWRRALRPKTCKLATHPQLRRVVARLLQRNWSPQQIAGRLRLNHPEDEAFWVSHETIYRSLFVQARGVLKKALIEHLRTHRPIRRSRHATAKADLRGRIPDTVSISERPASVEDRAVPGHWEGDLLCGSANSYMVTLVERQTRYLMLAKIPSRDTQTVVKALIKQSKQLPDELYKSLTWDREASNSPIKSASRWQPTSQCTSAIRRVPGSVDPTRTPIDCYDNIFPEAPIYRFTVRPD